MLAELNVSIIFISLYQGYYISIDVFPACFSCLFFCKVQYHLFHHRYHVVSLYIKLGQKSSCSCGSQLPQLPHYSLLIQLLTHLNILILFYGTLETSDVQSAEISKFSNPKLKLGMEHMVDVHHADNVRDVLIYIFLWFSFLSACTC